MAEELKACPFCGGEAERIDFGPGSGDNEGGSCVACTRCQASGPVEFGYKENFVFNWNRRNGEQCRAASVAPAEIESVIERLAAEAAACITVLGRAPEASDVRVMLDAAKLLRALSRGVPEGST